MSAKHKRKNRDKKREKFIKEEEKSGFEFKPAYIIGLLLIGGIVAIMLSGSDKPVEPQPIPPTPPPSNNPQDSSEYDLLIELKPEKTVYKKILLKDNKIVGFIFLGDIENSGIFFRLLKNKVNVSEIKDRFLSEDFGIVALPDSLRQEMFMVN